MVDDQLPDDHLFSISFLSPWFVDITNYLVVAWFPPNLSPKEKSRFIRKIAPFTLDWGKYLQARPISNFEEMCQGRGSL